MHFAFTEDQEELRRSARRFLATASSSARVRAAMESDRGYEPEVWERIARELGWPALLVPEEYGGAGAGFVELAGLFEETGRALLCSPLFATAALATTALLAGGDDRIKQHYLPRIAAGEVTATLAERGEVTAREDSGGFLLSGEKRFVVDGHTADVLIVAARVVHRSAPPVSDSDVALFIVPAGAAGLTQTKVPTLDMTRRLATIALREVRVPLSAVLAAPGRGWSVLQKTLDLARVALAAEQVGGAQRCLEMSVDYAKVRTQFGRPIGSFQAIKHKCADMFVDVESARSASYYAACVAASGDDAELAVAASIAKSFCSDAYFRCAAETIQIHGGIGFTWDHDAHLYFKRAKAAEAMFGDPPSHRESVAQRLGL